MAFFMSTDRIVDLVLKDLDHQELIVLTGCINASLTYFLLVSGKLELVVHVIWILVDYEKLQG